MKIYRISITALTQRPWSQDTPTKLARKKSNHAQQRATTKRAAGEKPQNINLILRKEIKSANMSRAGFSFN